MVSAWQGLGFDDAFNKALERVKRLVQGFRERFHGNDSDQHHFCKCQVGWLTMSK